MSRFLKNILFAAITLMVFVFLLEGVSRLVISLYAGDSLALRYGFDGAVRVRSQNRVIIFYKIEDDPGKSSHPAKPTERRPERLITIAAFGGSTTRGYNCSSTASSWPEELEKILNSPVPDGKRFRVFNFGADGSNSDYAVEQLPLANADGSLDLVLWANFVNESDILFTGPRRNLEALGRQFPNILGRQKGSFARYRMQVFIHRVDRTLMKYSLFYWGLQKTIQLLRVKFPPKTDSFSVVEEWRHKNLIQSMIAMALENYRINFHAAKEYCDEKGINMGIVRLPLAWQGEEESNLSPNASFSRFFIRELDKLMLQFSTEQGVPFINVQASYDREHVPKEVFCDGAHQHLKGHQLTARFIASALPALHLSPEPPGP